MLGPADTASDVATPLSPEQPWGALRAHLARAPDEVAVALERRAEMMYASGRLDELWQEVGDGTFLDDALAHPAVAAQALRVVGAMAWHTSDAARVVAVLRPLASHPALAPWIMNAEGEVLLAHRIFYLRGSGVLVTRGADGKNVELPDALVRVFADHRIVTPAARARAWQELRETVADPMLLLGFCDRISERDPPFAQTMIPRLVPEAPRDRGALAMLSPDVVTALDAALVAIPRRAVGKKLLDTVLDAANFSAADMPAARWAGAGRAAPPREYTLHARRAVARIMAELGLPLPVVVEWMCAQRGRVGRLARYEKIWQGDLALQLFGMLVTIMFATRRHGAGAGATSPYRG